MPARALPTLVSGEDGKHSYLLSWLVWLGALGAATAAMLTVRPSLDKAHVALAYLLVVLGASGGRGLLARRRSRAPLPGLRTRS